MEKCRLIIYKQSLKILVIDKVDKINVFFQHRYEKDIKKSHVILYQLNV